MSDQFLYMYSPVERTFLSYYWVVSKPEHVTKKHDINGYQMLHDSSSNHSKFG